MLRSPRYMVWRKPISHPYAINAWEGHERDTYRWRWLARLVAWSRTKAGWTEYIALPVGERPLGRPPDCHPGLLD